MYKMNTVWNEQSVNRKYEIENIKYKIELLMKPAWASKCKAYKLNEDLFTHIKLKKEL